jgi:peptidyl-tRNA hydrolase, PTH1 family
MKLVVGLGNPGPRYETTRHNAGFLAVDRLVDAWKAQGPNDAFEGEVWQASVAGEKVYLIKPQTFMNLSGKTVGPIFKFYKCTPEDLIVIHDDLDLKPLALRIKTGGGTGGHNGLKSIDSHLGSAMTGYHRIRIGIGKPAFYNRTQSTVDFVLEQFLDEELSRLDPLLDEVTAATELLIRGEAARAMNQFNVDKTPASG